MGWRKPNQGLDINQKAKGKKEGKNQAKFYVGISYGRGVVLCKPFTGSMNAERYCNIIVPKIIEGIEASSNPISKRVLQDNYPVMNLKLVVEALSENGVLKFKVPARSPDVNCIENVFHAMRKKIQQDAISLNIQKETFKQFQNRAMTLIKNFDQTYIDNVIDSMWDRIELIIKRGGQRIKY